MKNKTTLKVGIDIHGVCEDYPEIFSIITKALIDNGAEVHMLTGSYKTKEIEKRLDDIGIRYTHFFSILDYHKEKGTSITVDDNGQSWIKGRLWDEAKANYCEKNGISLHFDDSDVYGEYFTNTTYCHLISK